MKLVRQAMPLVCAAVWVGLLCASGGCGSKNGDDLDGGAYDLADGAPGSFLPEGGGGNNTFATGDGGVSAPCPGTGGLDCYVDPNCSTTLTGTVYDPAGRNPLYNVVVFIPNDPLGTLPPIAPGTHSCNTCDVSIGNYIAATTTDAKGRFTLTGVPATSHVPLVVQTGKWRREVFLPSVTSCTENKVDAANSRLPKNHREGDMPQMALLTGGCDDLGCFMKSMGIDDAEFTAPHGGGRLDIYQGLGLTGALGALGGGPAGTVGATLSSGRAGNCTNASCPLWASTKSFEYYDLAIFSCECSEYQEENKPASAVTALYGWLNEGGKVFASHFHYTWFKREAEVAKLGDWIGTSYATGLGLYNLDTSFPKGVVFHDWLQNVNALAGPSSIGLTSVASSLGAVFPPATRWIYDPSNMYTKYMSFLTPVGGIPGTGNSGTGIPDAGAQASEAGARTPEAGPIDAGVTADAERDALADSSAEEAEAAAHDASMSGPPETNSPQYCGKAVFTDLHTSSGITASAQSIPADCNGAPLTAQQKALEFLFFDLSACVSTDQGPPPPPPPPAR